eukprot:TRINITY_DN6927_c0_g2_i5.p1 TRINITY_DN6927_c0_g2~~TRINITY_DN6927_c0_g2_i5.p1  ORF type:complete len:118 (-),score=17.70 TRINITY_DN6927_c0_g2_i5:123-476(-)
MAFYAFMLLLSIMQTFFKSYALACIIGALCRNADVCIGTLLCTIISVDFKGSLDHFALYRAIQVSGTSLGFILLIILQNIEDVNIIFGLTLYFGVTAFVLSEKQKAKSVVESENFTV